jgi:hypothetical protein
LKQSRKIKVLTISLLVFLFGFAVFILPSTVAYSSSSAIPPSGIIVVVKTNANHYYGVETIKVSGELLYTPDKPGGFSSIPNFPVYITIINPKGIIVASSTAPLSSSHKFHHSFLSGLSTGWIAGNYNVTASYPVCIQEPPLCVLHVGIASFTYNSRS